MPRPSMCLKSSLSPAAISFLDLGEPLPSPSVWQQTLKRSKTPQGLQLSIPPPASSVSSSPTKSLDAFSLCSASSPGTSVSSSPVKWDPFHVDDPEVVESGSNCSTYSSLTHSKLSRPVLGRSSSCSTAQSSQDSSSNPAHSCSASREPSKTHQDPPLLNTRQIPIHEPLISNNPLTSNNPLSSKRDISDSQSDLRDINHSQLPYKQDLSHSPANQQDSISNSPSNKQNSLSLPIHSLRHSRSSSLTHPSWPDTPSLCASPPTPVSESGSAASSRISDQDLLDLASLPLDRGRRLPQGYVLPDFFFDLHRSTDSPSKPTDVRLAAPFEMDDRPDFDDPLGFFQAGELPTDHSDILLYEFEEFPPACPAKTRRELRPRRVRSRKLRVSSRRVASGMAPIAEH